MRFGLPFCFALVLMFVALELTSARTPSLRVAVFYEPGFPSVDFAAPTQDEIRSALHGMDVEFLDRAGLAERLTLSGFDVLITPFGSAFPKQAWPAMLNYLAGGGNWVNLGGAPLTVPVMNEKGAWRREASQVAYHKRLSITEIFPVPTQGIASWKETEDSPGGAPLRAELFDPTGSYALQVRFSNSSDTPAEEGSSGPREAAMRSLIYRLDRGGIRRAAPFVEIDRLQGEFAGGRWVLANIRGSLKPAAVRALVERAAEGATDFVVRPSFACYRGLEVPSFSVQLRLPRRDAAKVLRGEAVLEIADAGGRKIAETRTTLTGAGDTITGSAALQEAEPRHPLPPGLYRVHASVTVGTPTGSSHAVVHNTGFWIFDDKLLAGGKHLSADRNSLLRDGQPYPVTGTTYMASDVHRTFLFEPNPWLFDRDFAEMKAAGVNMIRTGIWTGWRNYMPSPGAPDEAALRALDAFLLTARKYDIPVIFNLFAFLPETWGGENPFLDPRAVDAQREFISSFSRRYGSMNDLVWDFINEPSFSSARHMWSARPNYDPYELQAWQAWLLEKLPPLDAASFAARLQERWRLLSGDSLGLPNIEDFQDRNLWEGRKPARALDYRLFSQEMFARWVKQMIEAIRSNGNPDQMITVGQDEGGLTERPNPHFFADTVSFTSMHNWWLNDDLLWDNVMAKTRGKANVNEETGIMYYERFGGGAWRTETESRNLLERKLALSLGANAAGFIEWIWNTNVYMASDNEVGIGLFRADGTAKPEFDGITPIARFFAGHRDLMIGRREEDVVMMIPFSQMFSARDFATEATKRCVRVMHYHVGAQMRAVGEYQAQKDLGSPRLIVVPSPRVLADEAWNALAASAGQGSTVLITGILDDDAYWTASERLKQLGLGAARRPVMQWETLVLDGRTYRLGYRDQKIQRLERAVVNGRTDGSVIVLPRGKGRILWCPLPVELSDNTEAAAALYRYALRQSGWKPVFTTEAVNPAILVYPTVYDKTALYTLVNEGDQDLSVRLIHTESGTPVEARVEAGRTAMVLIDRRSGRVLGRLGE